MKLRLRIIFYVLLLMATPIGVQSRAYADDDRPSGQSGSGSTSHTETRIISPRSFDHENGDNGEPWGGGSWSGNGQTNNGSAGNGSETNGTDSIGGILSARPTAIWSRLPVMDPEQTKDAVTAGQAASMPLLLTYLNHNYPGEVLDVKLHEANTGYVYEVRYLANTIFLHTLYLDAQTLKTK